MPRQTLALAMDSLGRMRQIDTELELLRSRMGGQGTGMGTRIDHTTILDVMRSVDEYLDAMDGDIVTEREWCARDVDAGWVVLFGTEALLRMEGMDPARIAEITYAVGSRYMYRRQPDEIPETTADVPTDKACEAVARWLDTKGLAKIKSAAREARWTR